MNSQIENSIEPEKSPSFNNDRIKEAENGKSDSSSLEEDANSSDSGYKPKTPSTAQRRKVFEIKGKDESPENEDVGNFERGNANRNSIAERRRLYESRSVSVTDGNLAEKATGSPTMRRRDSFKTKSEVIKEDEVKKVVSMLRQQSMDPRLEKVDNTAPTPKRTSTVFGKITRNLLFLFLILFVTEEVELTNVYSVTHRQGVKVPPLERYSRPQVYPH